MIFYRARCFLLAALLFFPAAEAVRAQENAAGGNGEDAVYLETNEEVDRQLALGKFRYHLEQEIELYQRLKTMLENMEHLLPHRRALATLFEDTPAGERLLALLRIMETKQASRTLPRLSAVSADRGYAIFSMDGAFTLMRAGDVFYRGKEKYRVREISGEKVFIHSVPGGERVELVLAEEGR